MAYGTNPFNKRADKKEINPFGSFMHCQRIDEWYGPMCDYADKSEDKELLYEYIYGAFCHFAVDRACHPYIFYRSGFSEDGKLHGFYGFSHGKFEAIADKTLGKKKGTYIRPDKAIRMDEEQVKKISKMWAAISRGKLDEMAFFRCYEDFVFAEKMLWTPTGLKRPFFRLLGKYSAAYSQSHPRFLCKYKKIDVLNERKAKWLDPVTGEESHESFEELLSKANEAIAALKPMLEKRKKEGHYQGFDEELREWVGGRDHDGTPFGGLKVHQALCFKKK